MQRFVLLNASFATSMPRSPAFHAPASGRDFSAASDEHPNNECRGSTGHSQQWRDSPLLLGLRARDRARAHQHRGAGEHRVHPLAGLRARTRYYDVPELRPVARAGVQLFGCSPVGRPRRDAGAKSGPHRRPPRPGPASEREPLFSSGVRKAKLRRAASGLGRDSHDCGRSSAGGVLHKKVAIATNRLRYG